MRPTLLHDTCWFPPVDQASAEGLLAIVGDLSLPLLLLAYRSCIFPWFNDPPILWWSPDPRCVLFPEKLLVSNSIRQVLLRQTFRVTINHCFTEVMKACRDAPRQGSQGSWINAAMIDAYDALHRRGLAISVEAWKDEQLVGGLYGVRMGKVFFGESMFSRVSNASKAAFISYVEVLRREGVGLIDCQVYTGHLASLGAELISRERFLQLLSEGLSGHSED